MESELCPHCSYSDNAEGLPYCAMCGGIIRPVEFPIVEIPRELVELCQSWNGGQTSSMYSVSSTSTIYNADILRGFSCELRDVVRYLNDHVSSSPAEEDARDFRKESADRLIASRWEAICERWEATLPEEE